MKEEELMGENEDEASRAARAERFRASGRAYDRDTEEEALRLGVCRIPPDIPFATLTERIVAAVARDPRNVVRTVPAWIVVEDEQLKEVE